MTRERPQEMESDEGGGAAREQGTEGRGTSGHATAIMSGHALVGGDGWRTQEMRSVRDLRTDAAFAVPGKSGKPAH